MDWMRGSWLIVAFACLMLLILAGCVNFRYYNDSGEVDAEIVIRPSEDAINSTIDSGEITQGVSAEIVIPISGQQPEDSQVQPTQSHDVHEPLFER